MRRKAAPTVEPPASLRVFDSGGLEGPDLRAAFQQWGEAREDFTRRHGWPGGLLVELQQQVAVEERLHTRHTA